MLAAVAKTNADKVMKRRASMEQAPPPGLVQEEALQPKPPVTEPNGPGPRSRSLAKESDASPSEAAQQPPGKDKSEASAESAATAIMSGGDPDRVLKTWGRAKARSRVAHNLTKAVKSAREMNRVMDYDASPVETHGRGSWGKSDNKWVVLPDSRFRKTWDVFQVIFLFYVAILTPLRIGFNIEVAGPGPNSTVSGTWIFELVVDVYFILDIFINFRTAYEAKDRFIERRVDAIKWHYVKSWFFIDLVACLPINYVWLAVKASQGDNNGGADGKANLKVIKVIRLLRLAKLLRLARLKRILKVYEEEFHGIISSCKLLSLFVFMVYVSHVIACFWYMFGSENQSHQCYVPPSDTDSPSDCVGELTKGWVDAEFADESIGQAADMVPLSRRYLKAFYWAITTLSTVGYGDITPSTDAEMGYACFAELLGSMIFGIMIGSLSTMLMSGKALEEKIDNQLAELQEFMTSKNIPSRLRSKVRRYMELYYEKKSSYDEKAVLNSLPPVLAQELMEAMYKDIVDTVPLFAGLDTEIISKLCVTLRPYQALADEYVYKQGEIGKELYIILHGRVEMTRDKHRLGVLGAGSFFGDEVIRAKKPDKQLRPTKRERSARAVENCDLAFLTKDDVGIVARDYPTMEVRLRNLANRRAKKDADIIKQLVQDNHIKEEMEANDRYIKITTAAAQFARPSDSGLTDTRRMEQYQAALTIQKHVRGHQARLQGGGALRKKLINSVLTVDSMNGGLQAMRCTVDLQGCMARQEGTLKVLSKDGRGLEHTVIGWYPADDSEPSLMQLGDLRGISFGYDGAPFKVTLDSVADEVDDSGLQPEWRCFSLLYAREPVSPRSEDATSPSVVDPIDLGNIENIVERNVGRESPKMIAGESEICFEIHSAETDGMGADKMTVEWLTAIDRMATEQLTVDGKQLYRGVDALRSQVVAEKASELDKAFAATDTNGDGFLDECELRLLLSSLGESVTDETVKNLTDAIAGADGTIGKHEFKEWMVTNAAPDSSNVRSYLLLCRQRFKIKGYAKKRAQEESEALRLIDQENALQSSGSPRGSISHMISPAGRAVANLQGDADAMQILDQRDMRLQQSIEQLSDAVTKIQESQAATNEEILMRLKDLDRRV